MFNYKKVYCIKGYITYLKKVEAYQIKKGERYYIRFIESSKFGSTSRVGVFTEIDLRPILSIKQEEINEHFIDEIKYKLDILLKA